jgi:hypothetical protein
MDSFNVLVAALRSIQSRCGRTSGRGIPSPPGNAWLPVVLFAEAGTDVRMCFGHQLLGWRDDNSLEPVREAEAV